MQCAGVERIKKATAAVRSQTWRSNVAGEKLLLVEGATKYYFSHLFTCKPAKAFHLLGALRLDLPPIHRWKRLAFDWSIITKLTRTYFTDLDILASLKFWTTSALTRTWHKKRGKFLKRANQLYAAAKIGTKTARSTRESRLAAIKRITWFKTLRLEASHLIGWNIYT